MKQNRDFKRPFFSLSLGAVAYLVLLIFAVIFTQALRSPISTMMFVFVVLLPIISLAHAFIGFLTIDVFVRSMETRTQKHAPVDYSISITNASPLAFPFLTAIISLPKKDGIACELSRMLLSLNPFGSCRIDDVVKFKYRGSYDVGVKYIYITDLLHIFCLRKRIDIYNTILVFPEKLTMKGSGIFSSSDLPTSETKRIAESEHAEFSNIREYIGGDPLKNIHWKMSSKMQELYVNEYNTNTSKRTYVLCDMALLREEMPDTQKASASPSLKLIFSRLKHSPTQKMSRRRAEKLMISAAVTAARAEVEAEPEYRLTDRERKAKARFEKKLSVANEIINARGAQKEPDQPQKDSGLSVKPEFEAELDQLCADGVVEAALARVIREIRSGKDCTLLWFDSRLEGGTGIAELSSMHDIEDVYPLFSTAPAASVDKSVTRLSTMITESINVSLCVVTANIDSAAIAAYSALPSSFGGAGAGCAMEVLIIDPEDRFISLAQRRKYVAMCESQLISSGISVKNISRYTGADGVPYLDDKKTAGS